MKTPDTLPTPGALHAEVLKAYMAVPTWADAYNGWLNVKTAIQHQSRERVATQVNDIAHLVAAGAHDSGNLGRTVNQWAVKLEEEAKENVTKDHALAILNAAEGRSIANIAVLTSTHGDDAVAVMQKRVHEIFDEVRDLGNIPTSADEALTNGTGKAWTRINELVNEYSAITTGYTRFFETGSPMDAARTAGHLRDPLRDHPYWQATRSATSSRPATQQLLTPKERKVRLATAKTLERIDYGNAYLKLVKENSAVTFGNGNKPTTAFPVNADRVAWLTYIAQNDLGTLHHPDTAEDLARLAAWSVPNEDTAEAGATAADHNADYLALVDQA